MAKQNKTSSQPSTQPSSQTSLRGTKQSHNAKESDKQIASSLAMTHTKVPKLRFKEFEGEWEEKKFKELLIESRLGGNYANTESITEKPLIKMGNLGRGNIVLKKIQYIIEDEEINEKDKIHYGDLFFNTRNTLDLVGKVAIWNNELPVAYYNSNLMFIKFENNFFMNYKLNSFEGIKALRRLATGTTSVAAIYTKDLLKLKFNVPSIIEEQKKIANFITAVDTKIQQLNTKKAHLQQYKKGVMQQLFSYKKRLQQSELRKGELNDFGSFYYGKGAPKTSIIKGAATPCVRYGELYSTYNEEIKEIKSYTNVNPKDLKLSKGGEVLVPRVGENPLDFANCSYLPFSDVAIGEMISVYNTEENGLFMTYYINARLKKELARMVEGGNVSNLYFRYVGKIHIEIPSVEEQQQIVGFICAIDLKIEAVNTQISNTQAFKKGLLQQMFV